MGLQEQRDALPRAFSGGQQQRVAIARGLMMRPAAMPLDEPTSALGPVMAGGLIVEHGTPVEVFERPQHAVTRSFLQRVRQDA